MEGSFEMATRILGPHVVDSFLHKGDSGQITEQHLR